MLLAVQSHIVKGIHVVERSDAEATFDERFVGGWHAGMLHVAPASIARTSRIQLCSSDRTQTGKKMSARVCAAH